MKIEVQCPKCGETSEVDERYVGRQQWCPSCHTSYTATAHGDEDNVVLNPRQGDTVAIDEKTAAELRERVERSRAERGGDEADATLFDKFRKMMGKSSK